MGFALFERLMPALRCLGMWRVEGFVMGNEVDAPVSSISPGGLFETEGERLDERSSDTRVPGSSLLCAAARTVPGGLIRVFGHGRVAEES